MFRNRKERGFTIIEMMMVIAVVGFFMHGILRIARRPHCSGYSNGYTESYVVEPEEFDYTYYDNSYVPVWIYVNGVHQPSYYWATVGGQRIRRQRMRTVRVKKTRKRTRWVKKYTRGPYKGRREYVRKPKNARMSHFKRYRSSDGKMRYRSKRQYVNRYRSTKSRYRGSGNSGWKSYRRSSGGSGSGYSRRFGGRRYGK